MRKFDLMMRMHFPEIINNAYKGKVVKEDDFKCETCEDFINGHCIGEGRKGRAVADCMMSKINQSIIEVEHKRNIN